jgi:hypothetical protein
MIEKAEAALGTNASTLTKNAVRSLIISVLVVGLVVFAAAAPTQTEIENDPDVQKLIKTAYFGFGPLGLSAGAKVTEGEAAMRRLLKKPDGIRYFFPVFDRGTLEGKCYALVIFRTLAPDYFESRRRVLSPYLESKVHTVSGCILGERRFGDLLERIAENSYVSEIFPEKG